MCLQEREYERRHRLSSSRSKSSHSIEDLKDGLNLEEGEVLDTRSRHKSRERARERDRERRKGGQSKEKELEEDPEERMKRVREARAQQLAKEQASHSKSLKTRSKSPGTTPQKPKLKGIHFPTKTGDLDDLLKSPQSANFHSISAKPSERKNELNKRRENIQKRFEGLTARLKVHKKYTQTILANYH